MTVSTVSAKSYTNAPPLHPNLFLGGLQIFFWLLFHPSAWRSYIAQIDPDISPNFSWVELNQPQWQHPRIRRLFYISYVVWPIMSGITIGLILLTLGFPVRNIIGGMTFGVVTVIIGNFAATVLGVALCLATSQIAGIMYGLAVGIVGSLIFGSIDDVILNKVMVSISQVAITSMAFSFVFGLTSGVIIMVPNSINKQRSVYPLTRQISGTVAVTFIGLVWVLLTNALAEMIADITTWVMVSSVAKGMAASLTGAIALNLAFGMIIGWRRAITFGTTFAIFAGLAVSILDRVSINIANGLADSIVFCAASVLPYALGKRIAGYTAAGLAAPLAGVGGWAIVLLMANDAPATSILLFSLFAFLGGFALTTLRPFWLYPFIMAWNTLLYQFDRQRDDDCSLLLRKHSAFWDELQPLPLYGLEDHLLLALDNFPTEGHAALEYLKTSRQRWVVEIVQIELDTRQLERCTNIKTICDAHTYLTSYELAEPVGILLDRFNQISQDVERALNQTTNYHQRLALGNIKKDTDNFRQELIRSNDPNSIRFYLIATHWQQIVNNHLNELARTIELSQEIDNPYIFAVPLGEEQEIFIGRTDISTRIERLLLDNRRPPLLLYGQRRMGKTSLLRNLSRLLPGAIVPLFVDLQRVSSASNNASFLYNIARQMTDSAKHQRNLTLPLLNREILAEDPFTTFNEWLDDIEQALARKNENLIALLELDEFEMLDTILDKGYLDEQDFLNLLRHMIQHRPRFKVLLASSYTLDEFQRWASHLINVQVVKIDYLAEDEACHLITQPVRNFALRYEQAASQRVLELTRGHPHLIQLLCHEVVTLKNEQETALRRLARLEDIEMAVERALMNGYFFFAEIEQGQSKDGQALLNFIASQKEGAVVDKEDLACHVENPGRLDVTLFNLLRRDLIEEKDGGYQFQIELIRHWFTQRKNHVHPHFSL